MIQRYKIETPPYGKGQMVDDESGRWVKYDDVAKIMDEIASVDTRCSDPARECLEEIVEIIRNRFSANAL